MNGWFVACAVCFRLADGREADGLRLAIIVLLGVTTTIVAAAVRFGVRLSRRSRESR